jgi:hypothetical protein
MGKMMINHQIWGYQANINCTQKTKMIDYPVFGREWFVAMHIQILCHRATKGSPTT